MKLTCEMRKLYRLQAGDGVIRTTPVPGLPSIQNHARVVNGLLRWRRTCRGLQKMIKDAPR